MMTELEKYYNKFNEEKRLKSRHGQVEFITSMKYIHKYLPKREHGQDKILDVGAGTGRYSVALAEEGVRCDGGRAGEIQSGNSEKEEQLCESISGKCAEAVTFSG